MNIKSKYDSSLAIDSNSKQYRKDLPKQLQTLLKRKVNPNKYQPLYPYLGILTQLVKNTASVNKESFHLPEATKEKQFFSVPNSDQNKFTKMKPGLINPQ